MRSTCCAATRSRRLPVINGGAEIVGSINDVAVMQAVFDRADLIHRPVSEVMGRPFPTLDEAAEIERAYQLLTLANTAIVVTARRESARRDHAARHHLAPLRNGGRRNHEVQHARDPRRPRRRPDDRGDDRPDLPDLDVHASRGRRAQGLRLQPAPSNPTRMALEQQLAALEDAALRAARSRAAWRRLRRS